MEPSATYAVTISNGEVRIDLSDPNSVGIWWYGSAIFTPPGIDDNAPQLKDYYAGFVNNGSTSAFAIRLNKPRIDAVHKQSGGTYPVEVQIERRWDPQEWDGFDFPVYSRSRGAITGAIPWLKMSAKTKIDISANDSPSDSAGLPRRFSFSTAPNTTIWYDSARVAGGITDFKVWLVAHREPDNLVIPIRQNNWRYRITSSGQKLTASAGNAAHMECPVLRLPNLIDRYKSQPFKVISQSATTAVVP